MRSSLIWVCTVCSDLSVPIFKIITVVTTAADDIHIYFIILFLRKQGLIFHVNPLLGRGLNESLSLIFFKKIKVKKKKINVVSSNFLLGALRVQSCGKDLLLVGSLKIMVTGLY